MFASRTNTLSSNPTISNFGGSNHAFIQPKLSIGQSGDKYEVEADKAADQIVARKKESPSSFIAPSPIVQKQSEEEVQKQETENEVVQQKPVIEAITPLIQRMNSEDEDVVQTKCSACGKEKEVQKKSCGDFVSSIQRKESITGSDTIQQKCDCQKEDSAIQRKDKGEESSMTENAYQQLKGDQNIESKLANSKGGGSQLDKETKTEMESGFGADFSNVRVHTDSTSVGMNQELGAQAFTNGNDIYFNQGRYNPGSESGKHLLAHELTHTLQQGASTTKDVQRFELPGFIQDGLDTAGDLYDGAVDTVANGMYDVTEALGITDEVVEAYEAASEVAGDVYDAATEYLLQAGEWLLTTAGEAARRLVESLGGTMTVTEEGIIITFPKICPVPAVDFDVDLPLLQQDLLVPVFVIPVILGVIDGVITGEIGVNMEVAPEMSVQLGPFCLEGAELIINPLTGNYSAKGGVSATAAVSMGAEVRAGLKAGLGFMGVIIAGEIPIPLDISLISIEGGVAGLGRAIGIGKKTLEGSIGYSNGALTMTSTDQLDMGLAADLFLGTYGQLDIGGFNFCRLYWEPYEWHDQIGAILSTSTELVIGPNPSVTKTATAEIGEFPFEEYELLLGRGGFEDDCPLEDMLCWTLDKLNLFPSQKGGTWENYGAGEQFTEGPKDVFGRDPQRASGAKCRGACGPDCMTCNSEEKYRYTDPETGETWEYINYEDCNTHEGCREHDAGFDWAAEQNWLERSIVSIVAPWHMAANIECACNYPTLNCPAWIAGLPPYDGKLYFADSVTKVTDNSENDGGSSLYEKLKAIEVYFFDKDPEEHKLFIEIKKSGEVIIMMASDEPEPLKDKNLHEQKNDDTDTPEEETLLRRGEALRKELVDFIYKHLETINEGEDETKANSIRDQVTAKLQVIAETVSEGGIDHNAEVPKSYVSYEMESNRAKKVTAFPLTNVPGNTTGSTPTTDDTIPLGWPHVRSFDLFPDKHGRLRITNWVKFHLLHNKKMHGPGVRWNLVPAAGKDNANYYRNIEEPMEKKLKGVKNSNRIFSFNVVVNNYRKATDVKPYLADFPESLTVNAKEYNNDLTEKETIYNNKSFKFQVLPKDSRAEGDAGSFIIVDGGEPNLVRFTQLDTSGARIVAKMNKYSTVPTFCESLVEIAKNRESFETRVGYLREIKNSLGEFRRDGVLEAMIYMFSESDNNVNIGAELESKIRTYETLLEENTKETLNVSFNAAVARDNGFNAVEVKKRIRQRFNIGESTLRGYLKGTRRPNPYLIRNVRNYLDTL
ncbi:MAG: DUF4157 domain-containing protein [Flavobacteriaceae bacterium]|nr:DUF4157 domain-containing protein [Flavobacteriaceae bacterium]